MRQRVIKSQLWLRTILLIPVSLMLALPYTAFVGASELPSIPSVPLLGATVPAIGGVPLPNQSVELIASDFRYRLHDRSDLVAELETKLSGVSLSDVLDDTNRSGELCQDPLVIMPAVPSISASFCWNAEDSADAKWVPQGITTSADALTEGTYEGETVILTSWYHKGESGINKGSRVSVFDYSDPNNPKYRNVLLIEPVMSSGNITFNPVPVHAGGIFWYGDLLYVADTAGGLRVFDMTRIFQVQEGLPMQIGLQTDGSHHAYDYKYVLPQVLEYEHYTTNSARRIRHSFVSLDRSTVPDSIVVGEFQKLAANLPRRLFRIPIDSRTRFLGNKFKDPMFATDIGAEEAFDVNIELMQGATSINGQFLVSSGIGGWYGTLYVFGGDSVLTMAYPEHLPRGPEDLSYWPARDQLWTLSELANNRAIVALKASAYIALPVP